MPKNICQNCFKPIMVAIFKGGPYCSVNCQKEAAGEKTIEVKS